MERGRGGQEGGREEERQIGSDGGRQVGRQAGKEGGRQGEMGPSEAG